LLLMHGSNILFGQGRLRRTQTRIELSMIEIGEIKARYVLISTSTRITQRSSVEQTT
jgi:hypothetical protein